jgi:hypothetical protein
MLLGKPRPSRPPDLSPFAFRCPAPQTHEVRISQRRLEALLAHRAAVAQLRCRLVIGLLAPDERTVPDATAGRPWATAGLLQEVLERQRALSAPGAMSQPTSASFTLKR